VETTDPTTKIVFGSKTAGPKAQNGKGLPALPGKSRWWEQPTGCLLQTYHFLEDA
jgi:hypothetical protein